MKLLSSILLLSLSVSCKDKASQSTDEKAPPAATKSAEPTPTPAEPAAPTPATPTPTEPATAPTAQTPKKATGVSLSGINGPILTVGKGVESAWDEGLAVDAVWNADVDTAVQLRASCDVDSETATLYARYSMGGPSTDVFEIATAPCSPATGGSSVSLAVSEAGALLFKSSSGARGQDPGSAAVVEVSAAKGKPFAVTRTWSGDDIDDPPTWASGKAK